MKFSFSILAALIISLSVSALALTPRQAFISAPSEIVSTIDSITRLDMIDYFEAGATGASHNALGGDSRISSLDDNHISIETSGVSALDINIMSMGRDTVMAVISTLKLPAKDATITMFNSSWNVIDPGKLPSTFNNLDLWLRPEGHRDRALIENAIPFIPVTISLSGDTLTVSHSLAELLANEDLEKVRALVYPSISYSWNGKKWSPIK